MADMNLHVARVAGVKTTAHKKQLQNCSTAEREGTGKEGKTQAAM
jgi:hypothetical protein